MIANMIHSIMVMMVDQAERDLSTRSVITRNDGMAV